MTIELRDYQAEVITKIDEAVAAGHRRIVVVAPTGAGKTIIAAAAIKSAIVRRRTVLVLAHRREIIGQTSTKLFDHGIRHGIIQAGFSPRPMEAVQIASISTLWARAYRSEAMQRPPADVLVIDEAHHAPAGTYQQIVDSYPESVLIGLTATPCRGDGRGLGGIFEIIIECPQVGPLIEQGYLVKTRVFAPIDPDLQGVRTQAGDYVETQLAERMDKQNLIGDIVSHWHRFGEGRKTVAFAVNVAHSLHIRDEFVRSGVRAEHIDGSTPKSERDAILSRLAAGDLDVVTNCMVLTEGWDQPETSCCILARPTKKMGLYRQMVGRILRPAPGKSDAIVLDHSGAVFRHGFVDDHVEWTLDPERRAESPAHNARTIKADARLLECSQCSAIRTAGHACPHCGFLPKRPPRDVQFSDGELGQVDRNGRVRPHLLDPTTRRMWHGMLAGIAEERGYQSGWVAHKYRERFGDWPSSRSVMAIEPTPEVRSWVKSRLIAFARRSAA